MSPMISWLRGISSIFTIICFLEIRKQPEILFFNKYLRKKLLCEYINRVLNEQLNLTEKITGSSFGILWRNIMYLHWLYTFQINLKYYLTLAHTCRHNPIHFVCKRAEVHTKSYTKYKLCCNPAILHVISKLNKLLSCLF